MTRNSANPAPVIWKCPEHEGDRDGDDAILHRVSGSRLAEALGVQHYQCYKCGAKYALRAGG